MASGHVNRANRPNTWLLRPPAAREESSCQPGAVHTWPIAPVAAVHNEVGCQGVSGLELFWSNREGGWRDWRWLLCSLPGVTAERLAASHGSAPRGWPDPQ